MDMRISQPVMPTDVPKDLMSNLRINPMKSSNFTISEGNHTAVIVSCTEEIFRDFKTGKEQPRMRVIFKACDCDYTGKIAMTLVIRGSEEKNTRWQYPIFCLFQAAGLASEGTPFHPDWNALIGKKVTITVERNVHRGRTYYNTSHVEPCICTGKNDEIKPINMDDLPF